jgi:hypothetical protein
VIKISKTDLAYIAGIVDGEAYVGIKKTTAYKCQDRVTPGYHARLQIRMVDEEAIKFISEKLGGWYYPEKIAAPNRRRLYCYQATDARAEKILRALLPFLRIKKAVAQQVLNLRTLQADGKSHKTKIIGQRRLPHWNGKTVAIVNTKSFSDEYVARCDLFYMQAKRLNATGERRLP